MSLNRLKVGVIGLGKQALEDHIPAILKSPDVSLEAIVETDDQKLDSFLRLNPSVVGYNDCDDMFRNHKLDFVVIVLPHHLHYQATMKALESGVHVFKEKPVATSIEETKKMQEAAQKNGLNVMITLQRRFNPIYTTFFQFLDKIGSPFYVDMRYSFFTPVPHEGWRGKKELAGGGCLIDMGYHMIDLLVWYFGLPSLVSSCISCRAKEDSVYNAEDTAQVNFKYQHEGNDLWGSLLVSRSIPPKQEVMRVFGTRGSIILERGKIQRLSESGQVIECLERQDAWPSAMLDQISYFARVIRGERVNISSPEFHLKHMAFIQAAYESARVNRYIAPLKYILKTTKVRDKITA